MKNKRWIAALNSLTLICILISCKPIDQTVQSKPSSTYPHPTLETPTIGHNETLVKGHLAIINSTEYFIIDTILLRGNSAPVISKGKKIIIKRYLNEKPRIHKEVNGILINQVVSKDNAFIWNFKLIEKL